jgi:DNA-binding MarR family transcriptional regulator
MSATQDDRATRVEREAARELRTAFKGVMGALRRLRGRETHSDGSVSEAQYHLLFGLREHHQLSTGELATAADLSAGTVTQMLEALAGAGLVERVRSERDRRVVLTSLTERGHALVEERHARFAPRWNAALDEFSDAELHTAAVVLDRLRGVFEDTSPG